MYNANNIFNITYAHELNLSKTYAANANKRISIRTVTGIDAAAALIAELEAAGNTVVRVWNGCGKAVKF